MKIMLNKPDFGKKERSLESYTTKEKWASLSFKQRCRFLWDYYKLPFVLIFIVIYVISWLIYREVTHKDTVLYAGMVNFAPAEEVTEHLSNDFLPAIGANPKKEQFKMYTGWYLTTDKKSPYFDYTYASQMKILASIDDEQLDVIYMNREAFDAFSQNGYLYNIEELLKGTDLYEKLKPYIVTNIEFLEDNAKEINFDETIPFEATTDEYPMGLDLSDCPVFSDVEYSDTVYLGVIANTPRTETVTSYLDYLFI